MGFFQELKDNLSQAVTELMPDEKFLEAELAELESDETAETEIEAYTEEKDTAERNEKVAISSQEATFAAYVEGAKKEEAQKSQEEPSEAEMEAELARLEAEEALKVSQTESEIDHALEGVSFDTASSFTENLAFAEEEQTLDNLPETFSVEKEFTDYTFEAETEESMEDTAETVEESVLEKTLLANMFEETQEEAEKEEGNESAVIEEQRVSESSADEVPVVEESTTTEENSKGNDAESVTHSWGERRMDTASRIEAADEMAVITAGMCVKGDITSEGSLNVIGKIDGNIDVLGKLNITGTINGNSRATEIFADSARIVGEVCSEGSVKIGQSSVIIGNITATSAVIAGAVKGDIDVKGPVILDTSAIVMGNIKSKSVQINNGAVIEGMCSQCYADVSPSNFFNEFKK